MTVAYCTTAEMRAFMDSENRAQDHMLRRFPEIASRRVDMLMNSPRYPYFAPSYGARRIRVTSDKVNSVDGTLTLDMPLLELVSVTAGSTALVVGTDIAAFPDTTMPPFMMLRLIGTCPYSWWYYQDCSNCSAYAPFFVTVTGWWGYHSDYASAWLSSDALASAMSDTTSRTLTVADVDGQNTLSLAPRFSMHSLIKIDSEVMVVSDFNTVSNTLTVEARGALGTTAATHSISAAVYVWQMESDINYEVARQAALFYARRGAYTTVEVNGMSEIRYPTDLLRSLKNTLWRYQNAY